MAGREPVLLRDVLDADLASLADLPMQVCEFEHITRFDPVALELIGRLPWQDTVGAASAGAKRCTAPPRRRRRRAGKAARLRT